MFRWLKATFKAKPPVQFLHPTFGLLSYENRLWSGQVHHHGRLIPFVVAGSEATPDPVLLDRLTAILAEFLELEAGALRLLCPQEKPFPGVQPADFTFQSVDLLWSDKPDCFTFTFDLDGDPGAIWRVEFEEGKPKYTGRDS